jgi:cell wall-associated NlpC family hydrolase
MIPPWVDSYVGIPFKAMGRDRSGLGCWGLIYLVYREQFGRDVPAYTEDHFTVYDSEEVGKLIAGEIVTKWVPVEPGCEILGDAILIRVAGQPSHIGVVVEPAEKKFLHVQGGKCEWCRTLQMGACSISPSGKHEYGGVGSCVSAYDGPMWKRRVVGFYRFDPAKEAARWSS